MSKGTFMKKLVTIIVVTYNSQTFIRKCLESISRSDYPINQIIVVDNNSLDRTVEQIPSRKNTSVLRNKQNVGFARAVNQAIKKSKKRNDIILVNPDSTIRRNSISTLLKCIELNDSGIAGGKSLRKDNSVHGSFVRKPDFWTIAFDYTNLRKLIPFDYFHNRHYYHELGIPTIPIEVDVVSGAFMYISRQVINNIGDLDNRFFMYLEDVDYCLRAKLAGFKVHYCPGSIMKHVGGASSKNKDRINHLAWSESRKYFVSKYFQGYTRNILESLLSLDDLATNIRRKWK